MDPDEVKAAIEAVFRAAQPRDDDVIAWNQDRLRRQLSSRPEGWDDPPGLAVPRVRVWPPDPDVAAILRDRGYVPVQQADGDADVVVPPTGDEATIRRVFPELRIVIIGVRGDGTIKGRTAQSLDAARRQILDLDERGDFPTIQVSVGISEPDSGDHAEIAPDLQRIMEEANAEADAAGGVVPQPESWPGLEGQLRRARIHNQEAQLDTWNEALFAERAAARHGGWRDPPIIGAPRLFLSYRWEDEAHEAWVDRVAGELFNRGYNVVYDRHPEWLDQPLGAQEILYRIAESTHFVAVVTEAYAEATRQPAEGPAPWTRRDASWANREWERARSLQAMGTLCAIALWRSGDSLPDLLDWQAVVDLRDDERPASALDQAFPELEAIVTATTGDGRQIRATDPIARPALRHVIEDMQQRFEPASIDVRLAPAADPVVKDRWLALHSFDDAVTRERIARLSTIASVELVEFRHLAIISEERAQRPADDGELADLISEALAEVGRQAEAFEPSMFLTKFGVVAQCAPSRFFGELNRLAVSHPDLAVLLFAAPSDPVQAYYASERPSNVYMLSDAEGDQRLSDVLTCLFADR